MHPINSDWIDYAHKFTEKASNRGFPDFIKKDLLIKGSATNAPLLVDDSVVFTVIIRLGKDSPGFSNNVLADVTQIPRYIALANEAGARYMHSLIQSLHSINSFQKAVYQIPTDNEDPYHSVALALQRLFYHLDYSNETIATEELTSSLGWTSDTFKQHDYHYLYESLLSILDEKMKGTPAEGSLRKLFAGRMETITECSNADYKVSITEGYNDIQLDINGCKSLQESLSKYIEEVELKDEKQYKAGKYGLQDAKRRVVLKEFAPVLHLQLNRFEQTTDGTTKNNDHFEFPLQVNLRPYASSSADKNASYLYNLHRVLVHEGSGDDGGYYFYDKPNRKDEWFLYKDRRVRPADIDKVLGDSYGGSSNESSAYVLMYIRQTSFDDVTSEVTVNDMPYHMVKQIRKEDSDKLCTLEEVEDQDMYMQVNIIHEEYFKTNNGFNSIQMNESEIIDYTTMEVVYCDKESTFEEFNNEIAYRMIYPSDGIRLWVMTERTDGTTRPEHMLSEEEMEKDMQTIKERYAPDDSCLKLYLDKGPKDANGFINFPADISNRLLVFVKYFDVLTQTVSGIGSLHIDKNKTFKELNDEFTTLAGLGEATALQLYEETDLSVAQYLCPYYTPSDAHIHNGDMICVQKQIQTKEEVDLLTKDNMHPDYQRYLYDQSTISFTPTYYNQITLSLQKKMAQLDIVDELTRIITDDSDHVFSVVPAIQNDDAFLEHVSEITLNIISQNNRTNYTQHALIPVDATVPNNLTTSVHLCTLLNEVTTIGLTLPGNAIIDDIHNRLSTIYGQKPLHVYGVMNGQYHKLEKTDIIMNLEEGVDIYAEVISGDDLNTDEASHFIPVRYQQSTQPITFRFLVLKDEPFIQTKKRLMEKIGMDSTSCSFQYAIVSLSETTAINDDNFKLSDNLNTDCILHITSNTA